MHPVFHISLLREYTSDNPENDVPDEIPAVNDRKYGDDEYLVHSIIDHKTAPFPERYSKGPALLFRVRWQGYGPKDDTWEPYVHLSKTAELDKYIKSSDKFRLFLKSDEYKKLSRAYQERFLKELTIEVSSRAGLRSSGRGRNVMG